MIHLIEIGPAGEIETDCPLPARATDEIRNATADLYRRAGFVRPWTGYFAESQRRIVGACGFKSPPDSANGLPRVEIAYCTFPEFEGRGIATEQARRLVAIALNAYPEVLVTARTLPHESPSTSVLRKVGFRCVGSVLHPDDGLVWEWHRGESGFLRLGGQLGRMQRALSALR